MGTDTILKFARRTGREHQGIFGVTRLVLLHTESRRLYQINEVNHADGTVNGPQLGKFTPASEFEPTLLGQLN